jgi:hypothetical protein
MSIATGLGDALAPPKKAEAKQAQTSDFQLAFHEVNAEGKRLR